MRRQEEIVRMLDGGEKVLKHYQGNGQEAKYIRGVVEALRWVLRQGERPMR